MPRQCEGRVALVTGASQGGTGTALAIRLAAEGARVAITARSEKGLAETRQRIEALSGEAHVIACDLSDPSGGRERLIDEVENALGPVDILVNNAAVGPYQPFDTFSLRELEHTQQINVWAPWLLMQQAIGGMRERGFGWVLNMTTSVAELPPGPPFARSGPAKAGTLYGGGKAMLNRLTVGVASEVEGQGIAVNALTPQAAILTRALEAARESGAIHSQLFEPLDTMVEAALALCTTGPDELHARIAYSLELLIELDRPVYDLSGTRRLEGWQPADLPERLEEQSRALSGGKGGGYGLSTD
ncbi:SDR family NAD(P)-dependent oxidoreductase [Myxococcota bacterium]|nr:SDR family NAD(P)-dependent oxidoreductase [Myxococcota bacterium]